MEPDDLFRPMLGHTHGLGRRVVSLILAPGGAVSVELPMTQLAF
ncbi:hypothetical protein [Mycobacterium uberis]|nr:hypothetical protein [Mycobacterium uberis]